MATQPRAIEARYIRLNRKTWKASFGLMIAGLAPLLERWKIDQPRLDEEEALSLAEEAAIVATALSMADRFARSGNIARASEIINTLETMTGASAPEIIAALEHIPGFDPPASQPTTTAAEQFSRIKVLLGEYLEETPQEVEPAPDDAATEAALIALAIALANRFLRNGDVAGASEIVTALEQIPGVRVPPIPRPRQISQTTIDNQFAFIRLLIGEFLDAVPYEGELIRIGDRVNGFVVRELGRVLPIDARGKIPGIQLYLDQWLTRNVELIESGIAAPKASPRLRPSLLDAVSQTVETSHRQGLRVEALSRQLQETYGVNVSRGALIARDQTLKLNGQLNQFRQTSAGITEYTWITSRDERVRKSHKRLNKTKQQWSAPPVVDKGRREHPGGDYQCRCTASPVIP